MVNLTTIAQARKPHLIYGVKRGKVPKKLRPHLLPQSEKLGGKLSQLSASLYKKLKSY